MGSVENFRLKILVGKAPTTLEFRLRAGEAATQLSDREGWKSIHHNGWESTNHRGHEGREKSERRMINGSWE